MDPQKPANQFQISLPDPLKHFSKDPPWIKLAALALILCAWVLVVLIVKGSAS